MSRRGYRMTFLCIPSGISGIDRRLQCGQPGERASRPLEPRPEV
jgi:hypothetical protein